MVEIPALELDGQNWKIYRTRILEVAATLEVLEVLIGSEKDNGSDYWLGWDMKARFLLYPMLPPQLLSVWSASGRPVDRPKANTGGAINHDHGGGGSHVLNLWHLIG